MKLACLLVLLPRSFPRWGGREKPVQYPDYYYELRAIARLAPALEQTKLAEVMHVIWEYLGFDITTSPEREREKREREKRAFVFLLYIGVYRTGRPDPNSFGYRPSPY
jgi:hypothetical protein